MSSAERVLDLLGAIGKRPRGAPLKEISQELDIPAPSVHRLLRICVDRGFCEQDPRSQHYLPGPRLIDLARVTLEGHDVVTAALPELRRLRDQTGETVFLTSLVGQSATCVAVEASDRPMRLHIQLGLRMPYHASAAARAILAFRQPDDAKRLIGNEDLFPFTEATPTTIDAALAPLDRVRTDGFASSHNELDENTLGLAAPIRDRHGQVDASICVALPLSRFPLEGQDEVAQLILGAAARVSASLGSQEPAPPNGT